jgi:hypothetical protein
MCNLQNLLLCYLDTLGSLDLFLLYNESKLLGKWKIDVVFGCGTIVRSYFQPFPKVICMNSEAPFLNFN